jgi:EAL domain-containing protein (putative c-di-GMP-specific phosphodiesterase class I)
MTAALKRVPGVVERRTHRVLLARGCVLNHYQPIVNLRSGEVIGVEALGRLEQDGRVLAPATFLDSFTVPDLDNLLFRSLRLGLAMLAACGATHPKLRLAMNVTPSVLTRDRFSRRFMDVLHEGGIDPGRMTIEILEGDQFLNIERAAAELRVLRGHGVQIALDDVGSAYSSLMRLRELPVDVIKLDQAFVRNMLQQPDDLQFVASMISLANGLRKKLVVEGAETAEIVDALQVLGVDAAQGYAIARPMPVAALRDWLAGHTVVKSTRTPTSLLGVYAAHLMIADAFRVVANQTMSLTLPASIHDPHACTIGRYLDRIGEHETPYGVAHKHFHAAILARETDAAAWDQAAEDFRITLEAAIVRQTGGACGEAVCAPAACGAGVQRRLRAVGSAGLRPDPPGASRPWTGST